MVRGSLEYQQVCTTWLSQVYRDTLGRQIGSSELTSWLSWLESPGATVNGAANSILNSSEYHLRQWAGWVQNVYQTYLGRAAGPKEVSMWTGDFQVGWTKDNLVYAVEVSAEFQAKAGAQNTQFVATLYVDMLGRSASAAEINGWVSALQSGVSRAAMISGILGSYEYQWRQDVVWGALLYQSWLGRPAGSGELGALATALMNGTPYETIDLNVLDSMEYYGRAARGGK
jgi:hypothetical protein